MKVQQCCSRRVVAISSADDIVEASRLMREEHVGFLIVYQQGDDLRKPIGVLTDRDVVLQVVAREVNPRAVTAADVMARGPLIACENDELSDALQAMRVAGIRRIPVVDARGALTGVVAIDDAIGLITDLLCDVSGSIKSEQRHEWRSRMS